MNYIRSAAANGSIGADEYAYPLSSDYPVAQVENATGYYVLPTEYNVSIALRSATVDENPGDPTYMRPNLIPVFKATDRRAYPLSSYSSMLVPTSSTDSGETTAKRQTLADFAYYSICQGQQETGAIGYAPLPLNLVEAGFTQIDRLKTADPAVDLTGRDVTTCDNPTFIGSNLTFDHLGAIAPQPLSCAKQGRVPCGVTTVARLSASRPTVKAGHAVVFHATVAYGNATGAPPRVTVRLQRKLPHHAWTTIATRTTSTGAVAVTERPGATASYRLVAVAPGAGTLKSTVVAVAVTRPRSTGRPKA